MRALRGITVLVLALVLAAHVLAADFQAGTEAFNRGDYASALKEWRPLAEQRDANAQYLLGTMYADGDGVTQDYAEAVKWYRRAAEQGHPIGQHALGYMYLNGQGVPQNYVQGHMWLNLAAAQLGPGLFRNSAVSGRDEVAKLMTPAEVAEAQRLAKEWKPK